MSKLCQRLFYQSKLKSLAASRQYSLCAEDQRTHIPRQILIIDDNPQVRSRVRNALEQEGLQVVEQDPCRRATEDALSDDYAVILLDIVMAEKDGFEYLRDIRRLWPEQRLILYTHGLSSYTHYAVKLGADAGIDVSGPANLRPLVETARRLAAEADDGG